MTGEQRAWLRTLIAGAAISFVGLWILTPAAVASWPMAGHDPAHSRSEGSAFEPSTSWRIDPVALGFGGWAGPPALVDRLALIGVRDNATLALTEMGQVKWRTALDGASEQAIAVDGGTAFVSLDDHRLVALDVTSGEIRWVRQLAARRLAEPTASDGDVAIATADGLVHLLLASNGAERWVVAARVRADSPPVFAPGATLLVLTNDSLTAFHQRDGSVAWTHQIVAGDTVIPTERRIFLSSPEPRLYALDPVSGTAEWSAPLSDLAPYFSFKDGALYVLTIDGQLQKFDAADGRRIWSARLSTHSSFPPIFVKDSVVVFDVSGRLTRYSLDGGPNLGETKVGLMAIAPPVPAGGYVLAMTAAPGKSELLTAVPLSDFRPPSVPMTPMISAGALLSVILAASWVISRRR